MHANHTPHELRHHMALARVHEIEELLAGDTVGRFGCMWSSLGDPHLSIFKIGDDTWSTVIDNPVLPAALRASLVGRPLDRLVDMTPFAAGPYATSIITEVSPELSTDGTRRTLMKLITCTK